ncbi:hypothetical protein HO173_011561 [Letharia columbiana]|uniref:Uncharacterized protein n=1 Tax=Letharia columbiana TaxID=112416 RepID=A0A8H6FJ75_9LECA|nr:uncharacterized protein HO173_011561 [Letharia columbiana]KAF6229521.1 hypothetical protein HO173_011561 [Letharia columbiana]
MAERLSNVRMSMPDVHRLKRSAFRALLVERLVQRGTKVNAISHIPSDKEGSTVTASFEGDSSATGNPLAGAMSANTYLAQQKAALQPLPITGCRATLTFPADIAARKVVAEPHGQVNFQSGPSVCFRPKRTAHAIPDRERAGDVAVVADDDFFGEKAAISLTHAAWNENGELLFRSARLRMRSSGPRGFLNGRVLDGDNKQGV